VNFRQSSLAVWSLFTSVGKIAKPGLVRSDLPPPISQIENQLHLHHWPRQCGRPELDSAASRPAMRLSATARPPMQLSGYRLGGWPSHSSQGLAGVDHRSGENNRDKNGTDGNQGGYLPALLYVILVVGSAGLLVNPCPGLGWGPGPVSNSTGCWHLHLTRHPFCPV
jgi:hypothetical protein